MLLPGPGDYIQPSEWKKKRVGIGSSFSHSPRFSEESIAPRCKTYRSALTVRGGVRVVVINEASSTPGPGEYDNTKGQSKPSSRFGSACFQSKIPRGHCKKSEVPPPNYYFCATHKLIKKSESLRKVAAPKPDKQRKAFNLQLHATSVQDLINRVV